MSVNDEVEQINQEILKRAEIARREQELKEKRLILNERRTETELEALVESDRSEAINRSTDFSALSDSQIQALENEHMEYIRAARTGMQFVNPSFNGIVPFFRKNLILIGGKTGEGKSTTVSNIAFSIIGQKSPETGKLRKVLIITNEEKAEDVYNRITCLGKGWAYTNHDKFSPQQADIMKASLRAMASRGIVTVIDNNFNGALGTTTTIEGIRDIFDNLLTNKTYYDAIIIDYYQKISSSRADLAADEYKIQSRLATMLDLYKNEYPAPIVLLAQVKPPDKEREEPFEIRIKGRKKICEAATFIMEMIADRKRLRTEWVVHKSRFTESIGASLMTGFDRGRFVEYTDEFQAGVSRHLEEKEMQKLREMTGVKK